MEKTDLQSLKKFLKKNKPVYAQKPSQNPENALLNHQKFNNPFDDGGEEVVDLGNGSEILYVPRFLCDGESWEFFHYLDKNMPWNRPMITTGGRSGPQRRDVCYVATEGLKEFTYTGHTPHPHPWKDFPPLVEILDKVHKMLPGTGFNSCLLNRYGGSDYVTPHYDSTKLYGLKNDIASVSFGCERDFLLERKHFTKVREDQLDQHSFQLKHGSLLVMRGYTQRDWLHSVPRRANVGSTRISLTFRKVLTLLR